MKHLSLILVMLLVACGSGTTPVITPPPPPPPPLQDATQPTDAAAVLQDVTVAPQDAPVLRDTTAPQDTTQPFDAAALRDTAVPQDAAPQDATAAPPPTHPHIYLPSQRARLVASLTAKTPAATRWQSAVTTWASGGDVYGFDSWNGALLSQLTGAPTYCAKAVSTIDAQVIAANAQIALGAAPVVAGDDYLQIGEMIGDLALVYDWCYPQITAAQRSAWIAYANQAVSNVWNYANASWGGKSIPWSGWAVDDPSDNYYYSFLRATMLLGLTTTGENPRATDWLKMFHDTKIVGQLTPEFKSDLVGGGSREGTGYGVAMRGLFDLYAIWYATTGENLADLSSHARQSISTMIAQITPGFDHVAPIGDQSRDSTAALFDYHRAYLLALMALYPTAPESARAASLLTQSSVPRMQNAFMYSFDFMYAPMMTPVTIDLPLVRYSAGIGEISARTSWGGAALSQKMKSNRNRKRKLTGDPTWINLIAGPYTQSHAHQDQGSFMIYRGGWLATDAVIDSHGGVVQSGSLVGLPQAHSLVRIDNAGTTIQQVSGTTSIVRALHTGPGYVFASVDITPAYGGSRLITRVMRQILWLQPDVVIVQDHVITASTTTQTWQLVIPVAATITSTAALVSSGGHTLSVIGAFAPFDFRTNSDFSGGWRSDETRPGGDQTSVHVITLDGGSSIATPTVVFSDIGVTFTLGGQQITLGAGVDTTP